jgi:HK97 family phage prohead protease
MSFSTLYDHATEFKAIHGQINVDEAEGIVECFVSGIGNKDSVGDIVLSGAFTESLKRRKPRVVWGHDWNHPIGKVLEIYEVPASDPRLPAKMRQAGIGGLFAKVQFNLRSEKGREAFANVLFYGADQEWSIGYKTLDAIYDNQRQANLLREVELYEVSPVLHGANQLTGTISIKTDPVNLEEDFDTTNLSFEENQFVKYLESLTDEEFEEEFPESGMYSKVVFDVAGAFARRAVTGRRRRRRRKDADSESELDSFRKSKWEMFDREFAARIKKEYPEIWAAGGNIKGNDQYEILTRIAEQGGKAKTPDQVAALKLREAWVARHAQDFRLPGVIAQIKWLAIGSRGESYMKNVVKEAVEKQKDSKSSQNEKCMTSAQTSKPMLGDASLSYRENMNAGLIRSLAKRFGGFVKILDVQPDEVMFMVDSSNGAKESFSVSYYKQGDSYLFGDLKRIKPVVRWEPVEDGDEEGELDSSSYSENMDDADEEMDFDDEKDCGCKGGRRRSPAGSYLSDLAELVKSIEDGSSTKAGRVISGGNLEKLQQAANILQEVIASGGNTQIEMKGLSFISAPMDQLFTLKSFIDPVLEFHGVDSEVTEEGISVKSISGNQDDFAVALENAVAAFTTAQNKGLL